MSGYRAVDPRGRDRPSVHPPSASTPWSLAYATGQHDHDHTNTGAQIYSLPPLPYDRNAALDRAFAGLNPDPDAGRSGLRVPKRSTSPAKRAAPPYQYKEPPRVDGYHILTPRQVPVPSPFAPSPAQGSHRQPVYHVHDFGQAKPLPAPPVKEASAKLSPKVGFSPHRPSRPPRSPTTYDFLWSGPSNEIHSTLADISKADSSSPKAAKKESIFTKVKKRLRRHRPSSPPSAVFTPWSRSLPHSEFTPPVFRPKPPISKNGLGISVSQEDLHNQKISKSTNCHTREIAQQPNQVPNIRPLLDLAPEKPVEPLVDPTDDWEIKAFKDREILNQRAFNSPGFRTEDYWQHSAAPNQSQYRIPKSEKFCVPQFGVARNSQGSSKTIVAQPNTSNTDAFPNILTSPTWDQGGPRNSISTLVEPSEIPIVDRDPLEPYSQSVKDTDHPEGFIVEVPEVQEDLIEISPLLPQISESPVSSFLLEEEIEFKVCRVTRSQRFKYWQEQGLSREARLLNTCNSFSDILPPLDRLRIPPLRTPGEGEKVHRYLRDLPLTPESAPDTPKARILKETYISLFGIRPSTSIFCDRDSEAENQALIRFPKPQVSQAAQQPENRGRELFRRSPDFRGRSFRRESYSPERRRLEKDGLRSRDGVGEGVIDKFFAEKREADKFRSFTPRDALYRTPSQEKQRQAARKRLAGAAAHEIAAVTSENLLNNARAAAQPPEAQWWGTTPRAESRSGYVGRVDGDSAFNLGANQKPRPKESGNLQASVLHKYSPEDHEIVVCTRSKTGTIKELPLTPANKRIIKAVLQPDSGYTDSVYSGDCQNSVPTTFSDLRPSPLSLKEKTPSPISSGKSLQKSNLSYEFDPFRTANSFLASCLSAREDHPLPKMDTLQVSSALRSSTKTKAEEDARAMQKTVIESCKKAGRDPPKYVLMELIGKGSFGRVYKGKDINTTNIVAVKIIDIDESDTLNPRLADTYSEFMKEVNALKILSASKAKNINHVIEALPVGTAMWMITEYCGGGSIATLMKPTPDGLKEKFIIPILREVAEAVKWVHQAGIIHRDLKCANILITEEGGVQLCDFGVAGITETAVDKRSTFIGTFHWMAPELFRGSSYGTEVDIWAFGSMTYEMATGLPPNAMSGVNGMELGDYLKTHIPRLEGDAYSEGLKSIVAFCLEENPSDRPSIEAVQRHHYIHNSSTKYPSSGLSDLVKAFKMWESHGGSRKSLFGVGGAQGPSELSSTALSDDCWNFSTTPAFDLAVAQDADPQDIINVYGASVALGTDFEDETSRPTRQQPGRATRRRPPPEALAPLKAPLEKLFDPNTISNYKDNAISHFNLQPNAASDLPLRDDSEQVSIRDTLIDLDAHDIPSGLSSFAEMDTMKPARRVAQADSEEGLESGVSHDFSRPALSDPVDNPNRRTQDWKFPAMAPPASAIPEFSRFPVLQRPTVTPGSGARPALVHHPTEPTNLPTQGSHSLGPPAPLSDRMSLIDLDMSIPEPSRPSTADSAASQDNASANPFMWERHASIYHAQNQRSNREPSLYLDDPSGPYTQASNNLQDLAEVSDFSASDAESYPEDQYNGYRPRSESNDNEANLDRSAAGEMRVGYDPSNDRGRALWENVTAATAARNYRSAFHPLPPPPSAAVLSGTASYDELRSESHRMFETLKTSLETFRAAYETMPTRPGKASQGTSGDDSQGGSSSHDTGSNIS